MRTKAAPKPGTLAWLRAFYGPGYRRGAVVFVGGAKAFVARALPDGRVSVYRMSGPSFPVNPSEVRFS